MKDFGDGHRIPSSDLVGLFLFHLLFYFKYFFNTAGATPILPMNQNFLVNKSITESLAGRVGLLTLLPLSLHELRENNLLKEPICNQIFTGSYPRIYAENFLPTEFYPSYILSCIERDIGGLINPKNHSVFRRFIQLCAGRIGQLCNVNALASETGISAPTAKEWLSLLEASYILFFLEPHFQNFNKRLVKTPKLYFFDTGLASSLLRIDSPEALHASHFYGPLFECSIISDLYKQFCNKGLRPPLYFWRDAGGAHEVDCIIDYGTRLYPLEIKSGTQIANDSFRGLDFWNAIAEADSHNSYLIYGNEEKQTRKQAHVIGWKDAGDLISHFV